MLGDKAGIKHWVLSAQSQVSLLVGLITKVKRSQHYTFLSKNLKPNNGVMGAKWAFSFDLAGDNFHILNLMT